MTLRTREFEVRAASEDGRTITGLAVPYDTPTEIMPGWTEVIARGAVDLTSEPPMLYYRHREPIGVVTDMRETDAGLEITARVSDTSLGRDAATLAKDGAIRSLSIGFYEIDYTDATSDAGTVRTQTRIDLREVSLVPMPAYEDARIQSVRHHDPAPSPSTTPGKDTTPMTLTRADLDAATAALETAQTDLARRLSLLETAPADAPATTERRSAGELIKAALDGDEAARATLAPYVGRATPNTTTPADGRYDEPTFISDLTRLVVNANPLMELFGKGSLPATGSTLEFAQLKTNTMQVGKQTAEGDTLPLGKVETETKTARIATYGGAATLSRQVVERSRSSILDLHLRGLALAAGKTLAAEFATFFEATVKGQNSRAISTTKAADALDWKTLLHMMLDARFAYEDQGMTCDGLVVGRDTFEAIAGMTDADGRPILTVSGNTGTNAIGTVSASGGYVALDGLRVITNRYLTPTGMGTGVVGSFYNRDALRTYTSGTTSLQDAGILDLTQAFSLYFYAAFADEIPAGLVPLKIGAAA